MNEPTSWEWQPADAQPLSYTESCFIDVNRACTKYLHEHGLIGSREQTNWDSFRLANAKKHAKARLSEEEAHSTIEYDDETA